MQKLVKPFVKNFALVGFVFGLLSCAVPGTDKAVAKETAAKEAVEAEERKEHRLAMIQKPLPIIMIGSLEVIHQMAKRLPGQ